MIVHIPAQRIMAVMQSEALSWYLCHTNEPIAPAIVAPSKHHHKHYSEAWAKCSNVPSIP